MSDVKSKINPMLTLEYLTTEHENKYFDRKSAKIKPSDLSPLVSAFANADGGTIVIGISDKTKELEELKRRLLELEQEKKEGSQNEII